MGKPKNFRHSQFNYMAHWRGSIDDLVTCPYNSTHVMKYCRLQIHIIKCQKEFERKNPNLAKKEFVICNYNTTHRFPNNKKMDEHLKECKEHMMSIHSRVTAGKNPYVQRMEVTKVIPSDDQKEEFDSENPTDYLAEWV